jgi:hypothetical protein
MSMGKGSVVRYIWLTKGYPFNWTNGNLQLYGLRSILKR